MTTATFTITAGLVIRGSARRSLRQGAIEAGVDLQIEEDKGLLESLFICRVSGEDRRVRPFVDAVLRWAAENGSG